MWKRVIGGAIAITAATLCAEPAAASINFYISGWIQCPVSYVVTDPFDGTQRLQTEMVTESPGIYERYYQSYDNARIGLLDTVEYYRTQQCEGYITVYHYRTGGEVVNSRTQL